MRHFPAGLCAFIKKDTVSCIAAALAVLSMFFVPPDAGYLSYIDYRVLALLFCLMTVAAGWQKIGVFAVLSAALTAKVRSARGLALVMSGLCFFTSMLITNDVALITFVPFSISLYTMAGLRDRLVWVIILETVAANLGSMLTPVGNPQNLYLFSVSGMTAGEFVLFMLPVTALSLVLVAGLVFLQKNAPLGPPKKAPSAALLLKSRGLWVYALLFFACIAGVLRLIPYQTVLAAVALTVLLFDRSLFGKVDYSLLLTFTAFFIFVGNMGALPAVRGALEAFIGGNELLTGIITSQVISNVPAAMLLSGFTGDYRQLLLGVDIGGLGTLFASMASLISYKYYVRTEGADRGVYIRKFTGVNAVLLAGLGIFAASA